MKVHTENSIYEIEKISNGEVKVTRVGGGPHPYVEEGRSFTGCILNDGPTIGEPLKLDTGLVTTPVTHLEE